MSRLRQLARSLLWPSSKVIDEDDRYSVEFTTAAVGDDLYLVPKYASHRPAALSILSGGLYEPLTHRLVAKLLAELGGDMVHAGTFFGDMLPSFSRACSGAVYAFEPVLENYILAKLSIERNQLSNVIMVNAALGEHIGVGHVQTQAGDSQHCGGGSHVAQSGQITTIGTIDSFDIENLSIVQLDVEGYELRALRGASESLRRCQSVVLIEDNADECAGFLQDRGYEFAGEIPGLKVWAAQGRLQLVRTMLDELAPALGT